jgi:hypothetical protein
MTLAKISSKRARARRRGESEEDHRKRIAAMNTELEKKRRQRQRLKESPPARVAADNSPRLSSGSSVLAVAERQLEADAEERRRNERVVIELHARLDRERREREVLERALEAQKRAIERLREVEKRAEALANSTKLQPVEIIEVSEERPEIQADHEIIEDFGACPTELGSEGTILDKPSECLSFSGDVTVEESTTGQNPLKGFWPVAANSGTIDAESSSDREQADPEQIPPRLPTLGEVAEQVLLIGWLDRARQGFRDGVLRVALGPLQRRIWRQVVAALASDAGCDDLDVESESIPFAFELAWSLRWALNEFAPCAPIPELAWRTLGAFRRPNRRAELGVLAGLETVAAVQRRYAVVERELQRGTLIIDHNAQLGDR